MFFGWIEIVELRFLMFKALFIRFTYFYKKKRMYVQRRFSFKSVLQWTGREIIFFTIFTTLITALYEALDLKWLQVPLAPVALVGTAVAFMVGFQNNAAYDRIWEARKICVELSIRQGH